MFSNHLCWLPEVDHDNKNLILNDKGVGDFDEAIALAKFRLGFVDTNRLYRLVMRHRSVVKGGRNPDGNIRLAVLATSTVDHIVPGIVIAGLRWNMAIDVYLCPYGQYRQQLADTASDLYAFRPTHVLLCFDGEHASRAAGIATSDEEAELAFVTTCRDMEAVWSLVKDRLGAEVLQQTILPTAVPVYGENEWRWPASPLRLIERVNVWLSEQSWKQKVDLVHVASKVSRDGLDAWHDPALWNRSKQEIVPSAGPEYGEIVVRVLAAQLGRSAKCLVLDLDNTIWGGVVGDVGVEGLVLGQGSALGEAFVNVQAYARALANRGVMLAVCSKNDHATAETAFETHPEMILQRRHIASFIANWNDKASNIKTIATELNIGLASIVFLDDNPFERNLVRSELPMVSVPEIGEDPVYYPRILASAGYFETIRVTDDDLIRGRAYQDNKLRDQLRERSETPDHYLKSLVMELRWKTADDVDVPRVLQLINKTNQFNINGVRKTETEIRQIRETASKRIIHFRLNDIFGKNGIISAVILNVSSQTLVVESWVLSCRVFGRNIEFDIVSVLVSIARQNNVRQIEFEMRQTEKNAVSTGVLNRICKNNCGNKSLFDFEDNHMEYTSFAKIIRE